MAASRISVVVPSYNQGQYLNSTLASVIEQGYPNLELIVMDGGSTDNSLDVIHAYEPYISYWRSERDNGQTAALVEGFSRSTGDIQCWLNSDDLHFSYTLHEVAEYFDQKPDVDAVYGNTVWIDAQGNELRKHREIGFNRFIWTYTYNYIPGMSMFWRRGIYEKAGGLDSSFNLAMDADLWIRMSDIGRIMHVRRFWSKMRFYPEQKNVRLRERSNEEDLRIRRRYWKENEPRFYQFKRAIATASRVGLKTLTGCYGLGYRRDLSKITVQGVSGEDK